jgi:hypothetical protein
MRLMQILYNYVNTTTIFIHYNEEKKQVICAKEIQFSIELPGTEEKTKNYK